VMVDGKRMVGMAKVGGTATVRVGGSGVEAAVGVAAQAERANSTTQAHRLIRVKVGGTSPSITVLWITGKGR
jgi:hypothetical protein